MLLPPTEWCLNTSLGSRLAPRKCPTMVVASPSCVRLLRLVAARALGGVTVLRRVVVGVADDHLPENPLHTGTLLPSLLVRYEEV